MFYILWVSPSGVAFMHRLGYKPIAFLSYLKDEDGDTVSGIEMYKQDALTALTLIADHNRMHSDVIKAYIK